MSDDNHYAIAALKCAFEVLTATQACESSPAKEKHQVYKIAANVQMEATVDDCHHDGASEWGVLATNLYTRHKMHPPQQWTKVSRVSYTPKRITLIARLIRRGKSNGGKPSAL